jgi:hypothetical protein
MRTKWRMSTYMGGEPNGGRNIGGAHAHWW